MSITTTNAIPSYIATATVPDLTTIFTPPASCSGRWVAASSGNDDKETTIWSTYSRDGYTLPVDSIYYSCLPRNLRGPHYSPGICTRGQTIAGMTKFEDGGGGRTMWQAQCCNSGMTIQTQTIQNSPVPMCASAFNTAIPVRALLTTTYTNGVVTSMYEYPANDQSTKQNITTMTRGMAVADPLYVAWEAKDLSLFPVAYATSLAQKIGVAFTPTASLSRTVTEPEETGGSGGSSNGGNGKSNSGLSSGAKIGIGVGAGGGLLILAFLAVFFLLRRRKMNKPPMSKTDEGYVGAPQASPNPYVTTHHELVQPDEPIDKAKWGYMQQGNVQANELDSIPVQSAPVHHSPVELDAAQGYVRT